MKELDQQPLYKLRKRGGERWKLSVINGREDGKVCVFFQ
jgi:hypothetical protein